MRTAIESHTKIFSRKLYLTKELGSITSKWLRLFKPSSVCEILYYLRPTFFVVLLIDSLIMQIMTWINEKNMIQINDMIFEIKRREMYQYFAVFINSHTKWMCASKALEHFQNSGAIASLCWRVSRINEHLFWFSPTKTGQQSEKEWFF